MCWRRPSSCQVKDAGGQPAAHGPTGVAWGPLPFPNLHGDLNAPKFCQLL